MPRTVVRRRSKVETGLPRELREEVDSLLVENATYEEISAYLKERGYDISKSSIGRYGKEFLNTCRKLRILEDQARALRSDPADGMLLEEAASKLFLQQVMELLLTSQVDLLEIPRILADFAKLQSSNVARERLKALTSKQIQDAGAKAEAALAAEAEGSGGVLSVDQVRQKIREAYGV